MQTVIVDHKQNLTRWKRTALNTSIYYICMILCYFSLFTSLLLLGINPKLERQEWDLTMNMVFMNSSINPVLYCWRLRELRHAVLKIIKQLLCKQTQRKLILREENRINQFCQFFCFTIATRTMLWLKHRVKKSTLLLTTKLLQKYEYSSHDDTYAICWCPKPVLWELNSFLM